MKIELVQATPNQVKLITDIASICYGKEEAKYPDKLLKHLFEGQHHSVLEHIYYTFKIEGISRSCLAQLTRHRHASYTVRSQRYCDESNTDFIFPPSIEVGSEEEDIFNGIFSGALSIYEKLLEKGVKKEDARFILPEATATELYMSCNLRELIHLHNVRTTKSAQWEIKELVNKMTELIVENTPSLDFMFREGGE